MVLLNQCSMVHRGQPSPHDYPTDYLLPSAYEDGHRETIRRCHTFAFNGIRTKGGPRASLLPKSQETSATQKKLGKLVSEKCCHQRERAAFTTPTCHQGKRIRDWISPKEWCCVGLLHNRTRLAAAGAPWCPETIMGAHGTASNHQEQKSRCDERTFPPRKQTNIAILIWTSFWSISSKIFQSYAMSIMGGINHHRLNICVIIYFGACVDQW